MARVGASPERLAGEARRAGKARTARDAVASDYLSQRPSVCDVLHVRLATRRRDGSFHRARASPKRVRRSEADCERRDKSGHSTVGVTGFKLNPELARYLRECAADQDKADITQLGFSIIHHAVGSVPDLARKL